jgi:CheY-like chemotaxis protein
VSHSRPRTEELDAGRVDVLVVDDDKEFRESLLEAIQELGFVAVAAADGVEALRLAADRSPRLVLLDLEMPVMNGWQFLERRRSDRRLSRIPVIVISAEGAQAARRGDVRGRLEKPVDEAALLTALDAVLTVGSPEREPSTPPDRPPGTILVIEDDEDTQASVVELLRDHGYRVVCANNGQEAEELLAAGARPDCIVLDLWMPVMNGWSFTSRLRQLGGPAIPIIVITAAEPYWGYPVPSTQVVRKPLHPDAFLELIRKVVAPAAAPIEDAASSGPAM